MLNVGDKIFMPNYGAGIVINEEDKKVYDKVCKFIGISLLMNNINLSIPITKIEIYKIRNVVNLEDMEDSLKIVKEEGVNIEKKWSRRYRQNNLKIDTGELTKECEVIRDLYWLKKNNMLPPGEQKILDKVENMVVSEMMLVYSITIEEAYNKLRN